VTPSRAETIRYGLPGLALAFAALPLYLLTPALYAERAGLNLAAVGLVLMATRLVDALTDPIIGRLIDRSRSDYWPWIASGLGIMALALAVLVNPPLDWLGRFSNSALWTLVWMGAATLVVSLANSAAMLAHQGWAVSWTANPLAQTRLVAARETWTLIGVILAAAVVAQRSGPLLALLVILFAALGIIATRTVGRLKRQAKAATGGHAVRGWGHLFRLQRFRRLIAAYAVNALANAMPATLVLFFIQDVVGLSTALAGGLLALYFISAAAGVPLWVRLSHRLGPMKAWRLAMLIATMAFIWALTIGEADVIAFGIICLATGFALGAELVCPPVLLGRVIEEAGHRGQLEASYFGIWNLTAKISLAAAAGLALPILAVLNYVPGQAISDTILGIPALQWAYAGLPCVLKLIAIAALFWADREPQHLKEAL